MQPHLVLEPATATVSSILIAGTMAAEKQAEAEV